MASVADSHAGGGKDGSSENDPLLPTAEGNAGKAPAAAPKKKNKDVDIELMLKQALRVRFPRMAADGEFKAEAKEKKMSVKKNPNAAKGSDAEAEAKLVKEAGMGDKFKITIRQSCDKMLVMLPFDVSSVKLDHFKTAWPPDREEVKASMKKYVPDAGTQVTYVSGWVVSAFVVKSNVIQFFWAIGMGMLSGIMLVAKNCWSIATMLWGFMDKAVDEINKAINKLQEELEEDIKEQLTEALEGQPEMIVQGVSKGIVQGVSKEIDKAQKDLTSNVGKVLPFAVKSKVNFMACVVSLPVLVILIKGALNVTFNPAAPQNQPKRTTTKAAPSQARLLSELPGWTDALRFTSRSGGFLTAHFANAVDLDNIGLDISAEAEGRGGETSWMHRARSLSSSAAVNAQQTAGDVGADKASAAAEEAQQYWDNVMSTLRPMLVSVLLNTLWAVLQSFPVQRGLTNFAIGVVQANVNKFIFTLVKENIPGGIDSFQKSIDAVAAGDASALINRSCTRSCSNEKCCVS